MVLNHQTVLICSVLVLFVLSLVQLAYGRKRGNFRPALDMGFGGLAFMLLCTFYLFENGLGPQFQAVPVVLVAMKIFFIYRANRGIFGMKAADPIDYAVLITALAFGSFAVYLMSYAVEQALYGIYVAYFYSKAFVLVYRVSEKLPRTFLAFIHLYLSLYIGVFAARGVYFLILPWDGFAYSLSDYGAETTLATLILFICGGAGGLIVAVFKADQDRISALEAAVDERDFANDLVSVIGHDLKSYISGIHQGTELIVDTADPALPIISNYSLKARNLLTDLVYYGRSRMKEPTAVEGHSTVGDLISKAAGDIEMTAEMKGIEVEISADYKTDFIRVDPTSARVVLRNVLQNSLKFSKPGRTINIGLQKLNGRIGVIVSDQGTGMSREQLTKVRDGQLVQSRDGSSGEKGTGTGLRLISSICRYHGWNMEIESTRGEGTTTTIWFPAADLNP